MKTFMLVADTANGVWRVERWDFIGEYPAAAIVPAADFIHYLKNLADEDMVASEFDAIAHRSLVDEVESEYGIH